MRERFIGLIVMAAALVASIGYSGAKASELSAAPTNDYFKSRDFNKPMLSMELQYFRIPKDKWDLLLSRMAQYHANTISTYVCWSWHEYEENKFDFTGKTIPERDLVGFIELVQKHGLKLVLKPGPFIDAEVNAGGIPSWMWEHYPETRAVARNGEFFLHGDSNMPRLSYLHPKYQERVAIYFRAFAQAVAKYQYPNGPIILVQVDNESPGDGMFLDAWNVTGNFKADYNPYYTQTLWPEWLKAQYGDIAQLNRTYGSSYPDFSRVKMPNKWNHPINAKQFQIWIDLDKFGEYQLVEGLRRFTEDLRRDGILVPAYQDLLGMPWDMAGLRNDIGGMAEAMGGWIASNNYAQVHRPGSRFVGNARWGLNWDEYIQLGAWRTRLTKTLSEPYPAFVPEITGSGSRFYLDNPVAWGADAVNIYHGTQVNPDNPLITPNKNWSMEACITPDGAVLECLYNTKVLYLFMDHAGAFWPDWARPEIAIGYSHVPEHAWNWEYVWTFQEPHYLPRHLALWREVRGTNTGDRTQLIARDLIKQKVDFDVIHLDHLKPGQLERYKVVLIPSTPYGPVPDSGDSLRKAGNTWELYLAPGNSNYRLEFFERQGVRLRRAWSDAAKVDVTERYTGPDDSSVIAIANRGKSELNGHVHFNAGRDELSARIGPKVISFAAVKADGLIGALIDHPAGLGSFTFHDDLIAFSGGFGAAVMEPGYLLACSPVPGKFTVKSKYLAAPSRLVRLMINGRTEDAPFTWQDGTIVFEYDPGSADDRTDLYVALGKGVSLEQALGEYLARTKSIR